MATGYTRNDTTNNIANGNVINANDLDGEFDAIQAAYDVTTGHDHDGTVGGGAPIKTLGPAQDIVITTSVIRPKTDNTVDLGTSTLEFKDLFIDGTANIDSLVADTADINGGTIDGAVIGGSSAAAGTFTTATATTGNITTVNATTVDTTNIEVTNIKAKDGTASATIADTTGVMTVASAVLTTADINGGTIDGTTIGGASAAAGTFTTATATTGNITTVNATTVDTTNIEVTTIKAKDGTSAGSIADSTGVVTLASSVLTTTDINGGTVDGAVIGGSSAAAITGTTITATGDVTIADKIIHAGDTNTAIRFPAADTVTIETSGVERLRVDSSGNVGIGTSSPQFFVDIAASAPRIRQTATSGTASSLLQLENTGGAAYLGLDNSGGGLGGPYALNVWHGGAYPITFATNNTERLRIDASGNVGIGTSTMPAGRRLVVSGGNIRLDTDYQIEWGGSTVGLYGHGANNTLHFFTNTTERLRIDASGNVGIGTSSQTQKLQVNGGLAVTGGYASTANGGSVIATYSSGAGAIYALDPTVAWKDLDIGSALTTFSTGGSERMRLDASGNLGLGVTPSAWGGTAKALEFSGGSLVGFGTGSQEYWYNAFYNGTNTVYKFSSTGAMQYKQTGTGHSWFTAPSGTAGDAITFTQAMTLDASGNLGIGTTAPNSKLTVNGNILAPWSNSGTYEIGVEQATTNVFAATSNVFVVRGADATTSGANAMGGGSVLIRAGRSYGGAAGSAGNVTIQGGETTAGTPGSILFSTGSTATERVRIDSIGSLLVGTTSLQSGIAGDAVGISLYGNGASSGAQGASIFVRNSTNHVLYVNNKTSGGALVMFYNGGNSVGEITSNGTGTSYTSVSDYRLKENVQPMQDALAKIAQLNPVTYTWKVDGSDGQGFIAHELQAVVPDCVTGEKDAVDEDGNPKYQGVDTSFLVATLVKAVQELTAKVASLEAQLNP
jgi:hypothetical protein